jgi:type II secretory pathway pseudopilin PulG
MVSNRPSGARGFTILEALLGITIFAIALAAFYSIIPGSFQTTSHDDEFVQAVSAGQQYMDALRSSVEQGTPTPQPPVIPIDGGVSVTGNGVKNASPGNFTITGNCLPVPGFTRLEDCTVLVTWNEGSANRLYQVESYATKQVS